VLTPAKEANEILKQKSANESQIDFGDDAF
jgi:hypothetical protein